MQLEESIAREIGDIIKEQIARYEASFNDIIHQYELRIKQYELRILNLENRMPEKGEKGDIGEKGERGDVGPVGPNGRDGIDGDIFKEQLARYEVAMSVYEKRLLDIENRVPEKGEKGDIGEKGERGDVGPVGTNGKDGIPGKDGIDGAAGKNGIDGKNGLDGKDGAPGIIGRDGLPGRDGSPGRDGKDGIDGKEGAPGKDGKDGANGIDGKDGVNFDECLFELSEDGKTITERYYKNNELRYEFQRPAGGRFRGAWKHDADYVVGDTAQCSGSLWSSLLDKPKTKPGDNEKAWQLIVRKGRDGKDGERGPPGPPGPSGKDASY